MKRPAVWATIFMICGIYGRLGRSEMGCLVPFAFIIVFISRFVISEKKWNYSLFLLFFIFGFLLAGHSMTKETAEIQLSGIVEGTGVILETGTTNAGNQKLTINCDLEDSTGEMLQDVKLYAIWSGEDTFMAGDRITFGGELMPFYKASVPGGYDETLYLQTKNYEGKMYPDRMEYQGKDLSFSST